MSRTAAARTAAHRRAGGDAGRARRLHHRRDLRLADDRQSVRSTNNLPYHAAARLHPGRDGSITSRRCWSRIRRCRIKTVADLIALAKANPGTLNYSSGGVGNFSHSGWSCSRSRPASSIVHVPYRGIGPATHGAARRRRAAHVQQRRDRAAHVRGRQAHRARGRRRRRACRACRTSRPSPRPCRASTSRRGSASSRRPRRRRRSSTRLSKEVDATAQGSGGRQDISPTS